MKKVYRLKNGCSLCKEEFYDGYRTNNRWCIYKPDGNRYMSCATYKEAYEIASNLVFYPDC